MAFVPPLDHGTDGRLVDPPRLEGGGCDLAEPGYRFLASGDPPVFRNYLVETPVQARVADEGSGVVYLSDVTAARGVDIAAAIVSDPFSTGITPETDGAASGISIERKVPGAVHPVGVSRPEGLGS